jgi:hypothetical protein
LAPGFLFLIFQMEDVGGAISSGDITTADPKRGLNLITGGESPITDLAGRLTRFC